MEHPAGRVGCDGFRRRVCFGRPIRPWPNQPGHGGQSSRRPARNGRDSWRPCGFPSTLATGSGGRVRMLRRRGSRSMADGWRRTRGSRFQPASTHWRSMRRRRSVHPGFCGREPDRVSGHFPRRSSSIRGESDPSGSRASIVTPPRMPPASSSATGLSKSWFRSTATRGQTLPSPSST